MVVDSPTPGWEDDSAHASGSTLESLVAEASRQLTICNACRYCEGFCAVFPALERRSVLGTADISQLANLCHDCRACFDACMYTSPHMFELNVPRVLSSVRVRDYQRYLWPRRFPAGLAGWRGLVLMVLATCALVVLVAVTHAGLRGIVAQGGGPASPYALIPYGTLLVIILVPALFAVVVIVAAGRRYWSEIGGAPAGWHARPVLRAFWYSATLHYLKGGGADCSYPDEHVPSPVRRRLHALVAYGFGLCVVSTAAAAVMQDILRQSPPYGWLSVPVLTGTAGGVSMAIGCGCLVSIKMRAAKELASAQMTIKDYGFLAALGFLAVSGIATLLTRSTGAFGPVFLIHLAAVILATAAAPYSKFVHFMFRILALIHDGLEGTAAVAGKMPG
jgi:citrate/tricarballylate utilization protein